MQLPEHFQLSEFTRLGTTKRHGIDNSLNPTNLQHAKIIANLKVLCSEVHAPLRQHIDKPLFISSGFRCPEFNAHPEVRGATKSQHMKGEAADIRIPSLSEGRRWMEWLISNLAFDQCIMEHCKNKDGSTSHWIHVSFSRKHNRQTVISSMWKK